MESSKHPVLEAIDKALYDAQDISHRGHLGASIIGDKCSRKLWLGFRWATKVEWEPRMLRLFDRGKLEEDRFVEWLTAAGITVYQNDPATGKQYRFTGYKGHFGGELDGVGVGILPNPFLLEFKTHGAKSFEELKAVGVEIAKWSHFVQVQIYMGVMSLTQAVYLAINKNTDEIYAETIPFDQEVYDAFVKRAQEIIDMPEPPIRLSNQASWWECKFCEHHALCHQKAVPEINCRTCVHSTPIENAQWHCEQDRTQAFPIIPIDVIKTGCKNYIRHPMD